MIRQAELTDIDSIMTVVDASREIMQADGNFQWDEEYPLCEHFERDMNDGTLYVIDECGVVAGLICINSDEPPEYSEALWRDSSEKALVIHRMAVSPKYRGRGFAGDLIGFACKLAAECGVSSIRTDTFSMNRPMNTLFIKHGFSKTGAVELGGKKQQPFYCYEMIIGEESEN